MTGTIRNDIYKTVDGQLQQRDCHGIDAVWMRRAARDCSGVDAKEVN